MTNYDHIKSQLKQAGVRQVDIARRLKITPVSVHDVITGKRRTGRIRAAIAEAIGKPVDKVFPPDKKDAA